MRRLFVLLVSVLFATTMFAQQKGTMKDSRDGKTYKTVKIGNQTWMAENLAYKMSSGCYTGNVTNYGYLYTYKTAKNSCPNGWHLGSDKEWATLAKRLGGVNVAGGKLKSKTNLWDSPNEGASNSSRFSALPAGLYNDHKYGGLGQVGYQAKFWTSTPADNPNFAWYRELCAGNKEVYRDNDGKGLYFSVRCIKN